MKKSIILFFIIGILIFLGYQSNIKMYQIQSGSMIPELQIGEIIILLKQENYKIEDIITYKVEESYFITHRIVQTTDEGYITKGDANNAEDEKIVKQEQIQGKVIFHSKQLGKLYQYRYGLIAISIVLFLPKGRRNYASKNKKNKSKEKGKNN